MPNAARMQFAGYSKRIAERAIKREKIIK